ncbi:MAG TPA: hypothetical protein VF064_17905 [Pyrinomonadaceae bacterium]
MGRGLIFYTAIVALVALVVVQFVACGDKGAEPAAAVVPTVAARRTLSPLPERALSPRLKAARERAMRAAAAARGLAWKGEVGMTELSGWEYGTRTKEIAEVLGTEDLSGFSKLAVAGGMLPEGTDLASLAVTFTAATAGATYSPLDKQVILLAEDAKRGAPANQSLLTHEFVHALQDQHFDLLKTLLARPFDFDRTEALFALVEGDAMNVERRIEAGEKEWSRRTLEEIARHEDERFAPYRSQIGALFPPLLTETFIFRYRDGARFVEAMRRARPAVGVDDIFRRPPASSEQVLHPEKYLAGEAPREVDANAEGLREDGWEALASTPLGEIGVRGLLLAGVADAEARKAAAGWGGDRAFVFSRAGRDSAQLFVWQTAWDGREDAREFFRAYNTLLRRGRGAAQADGGEEAALWREGELSTLVRLEGDTVLVLRGAERDVAAALRIVTRR